MCKLQRYSRLSVERQTMEMIDLDAAVGSLLT